MRFQTLTNMQFGRIIWRGLGASILLGLMACTTTLSPPDPIDGPPPRPVTPPPEILPRSDASLALGRHFARVQAELRDNGKLRRSDDGEVETTPRQLAADFERIALFREYNTVSGRLTRTQTEATLQRWDTPVRIGVTFGETVQTPIRATDTATVAALAGQLRRATGHPITVVDRNPNLHVFIVNEDERRTIGPRLRALAPTISDAAVDAITTLPRSTLCFAFAMFDADAAPAYSQAFVIVRGEHPDILRKSCLHEEIAQALGLPNDSDTARPSIFNDDEEFAYLTRHDEYLLQMLYDSRLKTGMDRDTAAPIIATLAQDVLGLGF